MIASLFFDVFGGIMFFLLYKNDYWALYTSYNKKKKSWKKLLWNNYMRKNAASISIDAKFASRPILPHGVSGIFITQSAIIGRNVVIFQQVTIGANTIEGSKSYGAPVIGNNVYIGAGAKIIGSAIVEDNVRIGANTVVTKTVKANTTIVSGVNRMFSSNVELNNTFKPYLTELQNDGE